jgi:branched-subunit amino acid transport protein
MDALTAWVLILGLAATSLGARGSFILFLTRFEVPRPVQRALRFVPAAVFTALLVPELVFAGGTLRLGLDNPKLLGALLAARRWRTQAPPRRSSSGWRPSSPPSGISAEIE